MLAVRPAYRKLKLAQRERALAKGIGRITWTFDPLQSLNAHFNFGKLGVVSDVYKVNLYGAQTSSFLHRLGTDRLWVNWLLESRLTKGLWNTVLRFEVRYRYRNGVQLICKSERPYICFEGDKGWIEVEYPDKLTADYLKNYERHLYNLASANLLFINSQSGKDFFSFAQNQAILERAAAIAQETGVKIIHETHRGKFSFSTTTTLALLEALPDLRLTADFSHWCNVAESFLQDQPEARQAAIARADHIHAG